MNALLESTEAMAAAAWGVIPRPTLVDGACDHAATDADQIRKWWGMWPRGNPVSSRTGTTSGMVMP